MPKVVREGDQHAGHAGPGVPFHKTSYVPSQNTVYANGKPIILVGDKTACGDPAVAGSSTVFVNGKAVHRVGDGTGGHTPWIPNSAASGSNDVDVG